MKASDLTITETERQQAASSLIQTEMTDAVNSGLVGKADKSAQFLGPSAKRAAKKVEIKDVAKQEDGSFAVTATKKGFLRDKTASAVFSPAAEGATEEQAREAMLDPIKKHGVRSFDPAKQKGAAALKGAVIHSTLADSELEGADGLYYKAKGASGLAKKAHRKLRGRIVGKDSQTLGDLAKKKYAARKSPQEIQRLMQSKRNQVQAISKSVEAKTAAASGGKTAAAIKAAAASGGGGAGGLFAALGSSLLPILAGIFALLLLVTLFAGNEANREEAFDMSGNESFVSGYLIDKGMDEIHAAAVLANLYYESGVNPQQVQHGFGYCVDNNGNGADDCTEQPDYPPELIDNPDCGYGLAQWTSASRSRALVNYAEALGMHSGDLQVQLDYLWYEMTGEAVDDFIAGSGASVQWPSGTSWEGFLATSDIAEATEYFQRNFERGGGDSLEKRIQRARQYLAKLTGEGGGNQSVVDAAYFVAENYATPYLFGGTDIVNGCDCSYFTQWCYKQAGIDIPRQSEAQRAFGTSIPISEAQPGDIVWRHGHVGIFIDENTVIEQTPPYCRVNSITYENWTCAVRITG